MNPHTHTKTILILFASLGLVMALMSVSGAQELSAGSPAAEVERAPQEPAQEPAARGVAEVVETNGIDEDPIGTAGEMIQDVRDGDWRHAIAGALVLIMLGLSKVRDKVSWFKGDRGGAILVLILGVGGGLITALYAAGPLDWRLVVGSVLVACQGAGIYTVVKRLLFPSDVPRKLEVPRPDH